MAKRMKFRLFCLDIRSLPAKSAALRELLTPERRARMERCRGEDDRRRCLAGGLLLRSALGAEAVERLRRGAHGKPFLPGGPCFSLSHAGHWVVLGLGGCELGVDVEDCSRRLTEGVVRCLAPEERLWLAERRGEDPTAFFRLWTAKESVMKAVGLGLALSPRSFSVLPATDGTRVLCRGLWHLHWPELVPGYALCTASAGEGCPVLRLLTAAELGDGDLAVD